MNIRSEPPPADPHRAQGSARQAPVAEAEAAHGPDLDALAHNSAEMVAEAGKVVAAVVRAAEQGKVSSIASERVADMVKTFGTVAERWLSDPAKAVEAQSRLATSMISLWTATLQQINGEQTAPVAETPPRDARFADPEWTANPYFNFIKQAYLLGTNWAGELIKQAEDLDPHTRQKAEFYLRQVSSAIAPSNFVLTNPELLRTTVEENGANLVRGLHMLAEDIEAGDGDVKIRQTDSTKFEVGVNMALTPGKVIFRNELIELIQYTPTTETVFKRPVLIVPPWINKYYVLDLNPEKSFIRYAVSQGLTMFVISWVNPDERHRKLDWEAYMRLGIFAALDAVEQATGEKSVHAVGYCVGGTLLAASLAYLAATRKTKRITRATLLTTQVDFTHAGELLSFVDETQIAAIEELMARFGYLPSAKMATAFNMLRPNDLIWSYVINNYLKGKQPMPFDLLYWNSDSTRMSEANHSFYLRNCYLNNTLARGEMVFAGKTLDLGAVKIPIYNLATREDHIAPALSVFEGSKLFGGPVTYVMAGSGHIAGVVNPPGKVKYQYWKGGPIEGSLQDWVANAVETPGSWWPDWVIYATESDKRVPARIPGEGALPALEDAPGSYVKARA